MPELSTGNNLWHTHYDTAE